MQAGNFRTLLRKYKVSCDAQTESLYEILTDFSL